LVVEAINSEHVTQFRFSRSCILVFNENMTKHQIAFIVFVSVALVWVITKSLEPGGGSIPWFLGFLFLALLNYYYGFVDVGLNPLRFYAKAGFLIFLILALLMAYIARIEDDGLTEIEKYVAIYPRIEGLHFVPRTSDKVIQHWQIETRDPVEDIKKYYTNRKNLRNWEIIRFEPVIVLEQNNTRLTITIGEKPRTPLNFIFYLLEYK